MKMCLSRKVLRFIYQQNLKDQRVTMAHSFNYLQHIRYNFHQSSKLYSQISAQSVKVKLKENVKPVNKFVNRTHTCGELTVNNVDEVVQLCGWLQFKRTKKFVILRDSYGATQCLFDENDSALIEKIAELSYESVLKVVGRVMPRPKEQCNPKMITGDIEVHVDSIEILNTAKTQIPFHLNHYNKAKETLQMQYRYLALRFPELQKNLRIRSWVTMKMREYLINECEFVDVTTPTLFRKTEGGAQEFVVPTKHLGKFYSLVQSPQQFKQLLMVGGFDRYFQVAQCYRDEGSRIDRQPEFEQLDMEMSFVDQECIMNIIEKVIIKSWPDFLQIVQIPFQRLTFEEAMETYGSDHPDLRIPGRIHNLSTFISSTNENIDKSSSIYATVFSKKEKFLTKSTREKLITFSKQVFPNIKLIQLKISDTNLDQLSHFFSKSARENIVENLNLELDDILLLTYGPKFDARELLGKIRVLLTDIIESEGEIIRSSDFKFVWIVDFPLFLINSESGNLETMHHPFTQPHFEDIQYLLTDPLKCRGLQYDLVMNGSEIGGGSIRIHQRSLQEQVFKLLNIDTTQMYYFLDALDCGAPPHGGFALGLDRYISLICKTSSIREVIAFPKTMEGRDLMSGAPVQISEQDKKLYHIEILSDTQS